MISKKGILQYKITNSIIGSRCPQSPSQFSQSAVKYDVDYKIFSINSERVGWKKFFRGVMVTEEEPVNRYHIYSPLITVLEEFPIMHSIRIKN